MILELANLIQEMYQLKCPSCDGVALDLCVFAEDCFLRKKFVYKPFMMKEELLSVLVEDRLASSLLRFSLFKENFICLALQRTSKRRSFQTAWKSKI